MRSGNYSQLRLLLEFFAKKIPSKLWILGTIGTGENGDCSNFEKIHLYRINIDLIKELWLSTEMMK